MTNTVFLETDQIFYLVLVLLCSFITLITVEEQLINATAVFSSLR